MTLKKDKIEPMRPRPLGSDPEKPEGRREPLQPVKPHGSQEPSLGFGDYIRIINRMFTNHLAQIMGLETSAPPVIAFKWFVIAFVVIGIFFIVKGILS